MKLRILSCFIALSTLSITTAQAQMVFIMKQHDGSLMVLESNTAYPNEIRVCTADVGQKLVPCIKTVPNTIERDEKGIKPFDAVVYKWYIKGDN